MYNNNIEETAIFLDNFNFRYRIDVDVAFKNSILDIATYCALNRV